MIPKMLIKGEKRYKLIKVYTNIALYEDIRTGLKESFTKYQLGLVKEIIKPDKETNKGGMVKH